MDTKHFFFDEAGDRRMEEQNAAVWGALLHHVEGAVQQNALPQSPWDILDIGCHTGGLLARMVDEYRPRVRDIVGIEPLARARDLARQRLPLSGAQFFPTMQELADHQIDVAVSNEVLYFVEDLDGWMRELKRVLRPDGGAFIALGSHGENTAWLRWRKRLEELHDHASFIHQPMEILQKGRDAGFDMEIARLHTTPINTLRYSPPAHGWGEFLSAEELFRFYNEWKYVFTFYPRDGSPRRVFHF